LENLEWEGCTTKKASRALVRPWGCSTPGGDRTPDLLVRSQALCPAELRAHIGDAEMVIAD
jgi:hypothetical protein